MTQPTCPLCARPIQDQAYVCWDCTQGVRLELDRIAGLAGEAEVTIARLDRLMRVAGERRQLDPEPMVATGRSSLVRTPWRAPPPFGALVATPWVFSPDARRHYDAAFGELSTWLRHCLDTRGQAHPAVRTEGCRHHSCQRIARGAIDGPLCTVALPQHPLEVIAHELATQLRWLRQQPEAPEALPAISAACRRVERVVDRPAERLIAGRCGCGLYLYARAGAANVRCTGCGTSYDVASSRDALRASLADALFTGAEIATLAVTLGYEGKRDALRNRLKVWAGRGLIVAHGEYEGQPAYRFGEVMARLMAAS